MVEKCKKAIGKGNEYGALLTDLSKAFDCVAHNLVIAELQHGVMLEIYLNHKFH